jgi:hypothetical protein
LKGTNAIWINYLLKGIFTDERKAYPYP